MYQLDVNFRTKVEKSVEKSLESQKIPAGRIE